MNELTNCEIDIVCGDGEFVTSRVRLGEDLHPSLPATAESMSRFAKHILPHPICPNPRCIT
jgi:hypothetical protein